MGRLLFRGGENTRGPTQMRRDSGTVAAVGDPVAGCLGRPRAVLAQPVNQPRRLFVTDKATNAPGRQQRDRAKRKPLKFSLGWQRRRRAGAKSLQGQPRCGARSSACAIDRQACGCWQRPRGRDAGRPPAAAVSSTEPIVAPSQSFESARSRHSLT